MPPLPPNSPFLEQLRAILTQEEICDARILVGVSGGADSVALLRGLQALSSEFGLHCVAGHINHGLRGSESDADADWVTRLSATLKIDMHARTADLNDRCDQGRSPEEAARLARYRLLTEIAVETGCTLVAVGHTSDDQTETILHHLIRGTGLAGLGGMPVSRPLHAGIRLIRPLLKTRRLDVERWLTGIHQDFRIDTSNTDRRFTRNRLRHDLLPLIEQEFNPAFRRALHHLSQQAAETSEFLQAHAEILAEQAVAATADETLKINCTKLESAPTVLVRETLRLIWKRSGWPLKHMGFREWQRLAEIVDLGGAVSLPGRTDARRRGALLVLTRPANTEPTSD